MRFKIRIFFVEQILFSQKISTMAEFDGYDMVSKEAS